MHVLDYIKTDELIHLYTMRQGGYTGSIYGFMPTEGISVAVNGLEWRVPLHEFEPEHITYYWEEWCRPHVDVQYIGLWISNGEVYFDCVDVFDSIDIATEVGLERNQLAIYDITNRQEIILQKKAV